jgi:hypothetical protein
MAFGRWLLGGLIGGAVGALIWVLVGYFTDREVGWIAWGIGFLVGVGVRYAAHLADQEESAGQGVVAAIIAAGSILVAKYLVYSLLINVANAQVRAAIAQIPNDDESMTASLADDIVEEMTANGQAVNWPAGMTYDEALHQADYPPEVWQQAQTQWNQLTPDEQQARRDARAMMLAQLTEAAAGPGFSVMFSPWDLLWFGLAVVTAFKIGVGSYEGKD